MKAYKVTFEINPEDKEVHYLDGMTPVGALNNLARMGYNLENVSSVEKISDKSGIKTTVTAKTGKAYRVKLQHRDGFDWVSTVNEFSEVAGLEIEGECKIIDIETTDHWEFISLAEATMSGYEFSLID